MSESDPFPTVRILAEEIGAEWPGYDLAASGTRKAAKDLKNALKSQRRLLSSDASLVLFGSFARREMLEGSDFDWSLLIDGVVNNDHAEQAKLIDAGIVTAELNSPGSSGTFGNLVFSHELVHRIGGGADSNANLTRRMLMLLESRPFSLSGADSSKEVWNNVLKSILERYFEEDHFSPEARRTVPRFLLNDLTRFWRTICVDYAAKHHEQAGKKWALRNSKLRFSRKLLYASGLAFCLSCQLDRPPVNLRNLFDEGDVTTTEPFVQQAMAFAETPALEYLAEFVVAFVDESEKRQRVADRIFGSYNAWLELLADKDNREELESISHIEAERSSLFREIRRQGTKFAKGLEELFFNRHRDTETDQIAKLGLEYIGF